MGRLLVAIRALTRQERSVLERALASASVGGSDIPAAEQIDLLQVVGKCSCGCASVEFLHLEPGEIAKVVADGIGETAMGEQVGVIVFALEGRISSIEIVGYSAGPAELPVASTVRGWGD
jgi:hypothetical protein